MRDYMWQHKEIEKNVLEKHIIYKEGENFLGYKLKRR